MVISGNEEHILVFPYPTPGHMLSLLDLTHQLVSHGLTSITILVIPDNLSLLNPLLSAHPSVKTLIFPLPKHPSIPPAADNAKDLPPAAMMNCLRRLHDPILQWFHSHPSPPVAIISDIFLWWTHHLAAELGIRRLMFSPCGAMAMSITHSLRLHPPEVTDDPNRLISLPNIPNSPIYPFWQIGFLHLDRYVEGDPVSEFLRDGILANAASWGIVFNSFHELEGVYLDYIKEMVGHDRVWAVGPLHLSDETPRGSMSDTDNFILSWLDHHDDRTVVYVSFGTQVVLTKKQMEAIAFGLEKSGARFIWVMKEGAEGPPCGLGDRVGGRGLVIRGWVRQKMILGHRSVGVFLTHSGWNSILEGLGSGVVVLTWAMVGDQLVNAGLLVDELKVGIRAFEGAKTVPSSTELARMIAEAFEPNPKQRARALQLREAALNAIKDNGSSSEALHGLVTHLSKDESWTD